MKPPLWEDFKYKHPNFGVETTCLKMISIIVKIEAAYSSHFPWMRTEAVKSSKLAKCPDKIAGSALPVLTGHVYEHTFMSSGAAISIQTSTLCVHST